MKKLVAVLLLVAMLALSGCGGSSGSSENPNDVTSPNESGAQDTKKEQLLYEDDNAKVTFLDLYEESYLPGNAYLRLKVENKSDKTVTVYIKDSYVNDMAQMMGTGVPIELAPGKISQQPFFFGYTNLGITSKDEIQKIEFKLWLVDDGFNTVVETDSLVVEFNQ